MGELFFSMLSDETEQIAIPDFVAACMRLRGEAKSIDMKQLLLELKVAKALRRDVQMIKNYLTSGIFLTTGSSKPDSLDVKREASAGREAKVSCGPRRGSV